MKLIVFILLPLWCATVSAQTYSTCGRNSEGNVQCSTTLGEHTYTCTSTSTGGLSCSANDPAADRYFEQWRKQKLEAFMKNGMTQAEAEHALHDEIMMEDEGELKARHELCDKGTLPPERCDFSKPHPVGYKVPQKVYQEGSAQELAEAEKAGRASKCLIYAYPKGVEVFVDDVRIGADPLPAFILMKRDKPRKMTFKLAGYKSVEKQIDPDGKLITIGVKLEKISE